MANERQTLSHLANQVRLASSRATVREFDDDHDMQQIKFADVYHSETPSDFERWQMVGLTATPLKQDQSKSDQQQSKQGQGQDTSEQGDWNHNQPKGPAAEAVMLYLGGSRSHPIGLVDDRRVRPYNVPEGATALYAASGTGQMFYHNDDGSHLVVTNNPKYGKDQQQKERFASMRHVTKQPQQRKFQQQGSGGNGGSQQASGGSSQQYKHEGDTVLTEMRATSSTVETRDGDQVVGVYGKQGQKWNFSGKQHLISSTDSHTVTSKQVTMTSQNIGLNASQILNLSGTTGISLTGPTTVNGSPVATTALTDAQDRRIAALEARLAVLEALRS